MMCHAVSFANVVLVVVMAASTCTAGPISSLYYLSKGRIIPTDQPAVDTECEGRDEIVPGGCDIVFLEPNHASDTKWWCWVEDGPRDDFTCNNGRKIDSLQYDIVKYWSGDFVNDGRVSVTDSELKECRDDPRRPQECWFTMQQNNILGAGECFTYNMYPFSSLNDRCVK